MANPLQPRSNKNSMSRQLKDPTFSDKVFTWKDGKLWFDSGIKLFKQIKNYWYLLCFVLALVMMLSANISITLAGILTVFISPLITAFVMSLCQSINDKTVFTFSSIGSSLLMQLNSFLLLGVYAVLISLLFQQVHIQLLVMFQLPAELTESMMENMSGKESVLRAILNLVTNLPVALAMAFAPALLLFNHSPPHTAIKYSVIGVLKTWKPFVALALLFILMFFAAVMLAVLLISIIMAVLGPASQVMINVIVLLFVVTIAGIGLCAQYQAFIEVFNIQKDDSNIDAAEIYTEI